MNVFDLLFPDIIRQDFVPFVAIVDIVTDVAARAEAERHRGALLQRDARAEFELEVLQRMQIA